MNLIICCTPLQVLIAEKIMAQHTDSRFFGVMLQTVENAKFDYYKARLKAKTDGFFAMVQHRERNYLFRELLRLKREFRGRRFQQVFVANFTELHVQCLLSAIQFDSLSTFDDGTMNIVPNSYLLQDEPKTWPRRLINMLLGNRYSTRRLRELSVCHYTIYPDFPNIIAHTVPISLGTAMATPVASSSTLPPLRLLLGQPVYADDAKNIALAEQVIRDFQIEAYLPHPREAYRVEGVDYVETPLILEEYLSEGLGGRACEIYTYFSSAVLNVYRLPQVRVTAIRVETDHPSFLACYDLLAQAGIPIVEMKKAHE